MDFQQTFSDSRNDNSKTKNIINVPKIRNTEKIVVPQHSNQPNVMKQITVSTDSLTSNQLQLIRDQQQLQMQIQQQLQQQIMKHKRPPQNQQLQQEIKAIANFKAQIQEHLQMRQANVVNGVLTQTAPQYTSILNKKDNVVTNVGSLSQVSEVNYISRSPSFFFPFSVLKMNVIFRIATENSCNSAS